MGVFDEEIDNSVFQNNIPLHLIYHFVKFINSVSKNCLE